MLTGTGMAMKECIPKDTSIPIGWDYAAPGDKRISLVPTEQLINIKGSSKSKGIQWDVHCAGFLFKGVNVWSKITGTTTKDHRGQAYKFFPGDVLIEKHQ